MLTVVQDCLATTVMVICSADGRQLRHKYHRYPPSIHSALHILANLSASPRRQSIAVNPYIMSEPLNTPILPYSPVIFNEIRSLREAFEAIEAKEAEHPNLLDLFRQVFVSASKNNIFGISLLPKHFPISDHQVMVELNTVTSPWHVYSLTIE